MHNEFSSHGVISRKQANAYGRVYGKFATAADAANELALRGYEISPFLIGHKSTFVWLTDNEKLATSAAVVAPGGPGKSYGIAFCL